MECIEDTVHHSTPTRPCSSVCSLSHFTPLHRQGSLHLSHICLHSVLPTHQALTPLHVLFSVTAHSPLPLTLQVVLRCPSSEEDGFASLCVIHTDTHSHLSTPEHAHTYTQLEVPRGQEPTQVSAHSMTAPPAPSTGSDHTAVASTCAITSSIQSQPRCE